EDQPLHEDAWRMYQVRIDRAVFDDLFDLGDGDLAAHRNHRIEVARGLAIDEVALLVRLPRLDQRNVGTNAALHDVFLAVEFAHVLALGNDRADAGLGEERRDAGTARTHALGERALRRELELQFARQILPLELLVL